jgi:hypothetical protein
MSMDAKLILSFRGDLTQLMHPSKIWLEFLYLGKQSQINSFQNLGSVSN